MYLYFANRSMSKEQKKKKKRKRGKKEKKDIRMTTTNNLTNQSISHLFESSKSP